MKAPALRRWAFVVDALAERAVIALLIVLVAWLATLQSWPAWTAPSFARVVAICALILAYVALCVWAHRRGRKPAASDEASPDDALWIVHASQTGNAERIATQTQEALRDMGVRVQLHALDQIDPAGLARAQRALFVVSTTGEGDAPDSAFGFLGALERAFELNTLRYGLLALGDSSFANFCAFGRRLDAWLKLGGASACFDLVEVDDGDEAALRHWRHQVGWFAGCVELPDHAPRLERWRLTSRHQTNPGSVGEPCFHLELEPEAQLPTWRAGDLVEISPRHGAAKVDQLIHALGLDANARVIDRGVPSTLREVIARSAWPLPADAAMIEPQALVARLRALPLREYSIASVHADRRIDLLVRSRRHADGTCGIGSLWLNEHARIGETIELRVRSNANFHAPDDDRPLILIGNGTGIAGLRALLRERVARGLRRHWLLFGERNQAYDFHYRCEIEHWYETGLIERIDLAFSRDQAERIYVQHRLAAAAAQLRAWLDDGAAIRICGSFEGMAPGVHQVLVDALGESALAELSASGRYRRDVY